MKYLLCAIFGHDFTPWAFICPQHNGDQYRLCKRCSRLDVRMEHV